MSRTARSLMFFTTMLLVLGFNRPLRAAFDGPVRVQVVHSFLGGVTDGAIPVAALIRGTDGAFYGTTDEGGPANAGTVFRMTSGGAVTLLHSFTGGADGGRPMAALIQASDGNFYGTTYAGGNAGHGTVFRLTPAGTFTTLHSFVGGSEGSRPRAALLETGGGNFFGTTQFGGGFGRGTLFEMTPAGAVTTRYRFTGGFDGAYPYASVIQATDGNLYGTTYGGDVSTFGRVYRMTPAGVVTAIHTFTSGADGANPIGGLVQASDGNLYGTTHFGGAANAGTAFRMTLGGITTVLHSFGGSDGENPGASLIQGIDGNFYGTTKIGGLNYGTIFKMTPAGDLTVLYAFAGGQDGSNSSAALFQTSNGKLYGTANFGGAASRGVAFRLPPTTLGDFDGDGEAEISVFRPSNGNWYIRYSATPTDETFIWGGNGDVPVAGDYDGDGKADIAVFRPSNGNWFIRYSGTPTSATFVWGGSGDVPVPGDYDGDDLTDIAVFRPSNGNWYVRYSATPTSATFIWGGAGDVPAARDYDGDGLTDITVFRPSNGNWYVRNSATPTSTTFVWGGGGDVPVSSDFDGDGKADVAVFRPSTGNWFVRYSKTPTSQTFIWGGGTDVPVPGDFDGDSKADIAVFRPSNGNWYIRYSATPTSLTFIWGGAGDIPILKRP